MGLTESVTGGGWVRYKIQNDICEKVCQKVCQGDKKTQNTRTQHLFLYLHNRTHTFTMTVTIIAINIALHTAAIATPTNALDDFNNFQVYTRSSQVGMGYTMVAVF